MDSVRIIITDRSGKLIIEDPNYTDYSFSSDLYTIADSFELTIINQLNITNWYGVQFDVNNKVAFVGIIQRSTRSVSKGVRGLTLSGKDRGSFLTESFCTTYDDFSNKTPEFIVNALIDQTAFYAQPVSNYELVVAQSNWDNVTDIQAFNLANQDNIKKNKAFLRSKNKTEFDTAFTKLSPKKHFKVEIGDRVGEKLIELVRSVGMDIVYDQTGVLFFGNIIKRRLSTSFNHKIILTEDDLGNNTLSADIDVDDSGRHSKITVFSQVQGETNSSATATDSSVVDVKSMAVIINDDDGSAEKEAIRIREDQRSISFRGTYTFSGHVDKENSTLWGLNETVRMQDKINSVTGDYMTTEVNYTFSRPEGQKTEVSIALPRKEALEI